MDLLDVALAWLPTMTDLVIYGSMATAAAAIYTISYFGIIGSFYRCACCRLGLAWLSRPAWEGCCGCRLPAAR